MPLDRGEAILLQQILAHPSGVLTRAEITARNQDVTGDALQSRVERLLNRGVITRLDSHFAVTESGIEVLKESNLFDEIGIWSETYSVVDERDVVDDRPSPEWYPELTSPVERRARERFDESFGTFEDAVKRKESLSHPTRYSILCYLHDDGEQTREDIDAMVEDDVEDHINELIDAGLAARVGAPEDQGEGEETVYRITHVGRQEIETDIERTGQRRDRIAERVLQQDEFATDLNAQGYTDVLVLRRDTALDVLTDNRLEIIQHIQHGDIDSVSDLARRLDRDETAVSEDLHRLAELDVTEFSDERPALKHSHVVIEPVY